MRTVHEVMGIPMSLDLRDPGDPALLAAASEAAFAVLRSADLRFSPWRPSSELSRYARGETAPSADLAEVLDIAARAEQASGGAFSVRAPDGSLDTNGVVKGWAAQRAATTLRRFGLGRFCLNAGGDVVLAGEPEPGRGWRTGVRDPEHPDRMLAVLELRDGAVATSGTYERGAHVWDGRTGRAAVGLRGVTVVAEDLTTADVLATCVLALGPDGVAWAGGHGARRVIAVLPDGSLLTDAPADPGTVPEQGRAGAAA